MVLNPYQEHWFLKLCTSSPAITFVPLPCTECLSGAPVPGHPFLIRSWITDRIEDVKCSFLPEYTVLLSRAGKIGSIHQDRTVSLRTTSCVRSVPSLAKSEQPFFCKEPASRHLRWHRPHAHHSSLQKQSLPRGGCGVPEEPSRISQWVTSSLRLQFAVDKPHCPVVCVPDFSSHDQSKPLLLGLGITSAKVQVAQGTQVNESGGLTALFLRSARAREDETQGA